MANTVSALKRVRQTERKTDVNRLRKSRMRTEIKKMRKLLGGTDANAAQAAIPQTYSIIDRAAKWGIIKKNTAARYKARITARLKKLAAPVAA
jgi:small subunit ribosomal protein S20